MGKARIISDVMDLAEESDLEFNRKTRTIEPEQTAVEVTPAKPRTIPAPTRRADNIYD